MTESQMLRVIFDDMQMMKGDMQELKTDVQDLKSDVQGLKSDVQVLKDKMQVVEENVRDLQLTLENETNRNIRIIAEGHHDLNRKLDEALKVESEKELMRLRVNVLENDKRKVKEKVVIAKKKDKRIFMNQRRMLCTCFLRGS